MSAMAVEMSTLSSQMQARTAAVRDELRRKEEADLKARAVAWREREKQKAKTAIARLPAVIKGVAEKGKSDLIVRMDVRGPYTTDEMRKMYKVIDLYHSPHFPSYDVPSEQHIQLTSYKLKKLRDGARMIASWALREGFAVYCRIWEDRLGREEVDRYEHFIVDDVRSQFIDGDDSENWPVCEGLLIRW
ncbi:MAG: hypothetical protein PHD04_03030 [Candidatus Pacebacteria bacterium]|nr:hypothetical protein [Candidatus Paceibacterota bacterium]